MAKNLPKKQASGFRSKSKARKKSKRQKGQVVSTRYRDFKCRRIYHVFQRGNHGRRVFRSDHERFTYLEHLFLLSKRYSVKIHNFCLMPTHVHFVLEQRQKCGISNLMRDLQSAHAREQNVRMNTHGNLWTQHFGCRHVKGDAYFRTLMWYVENNPVKTGSCAKAQDYQWSGARVYATGGPVTLRVNGRELRIALHMDEWERVCKEATWKKQLEAGNVAKEMTEEIEKIESIYDKKSLAQFALEEVVRQRNAERAKERARKRNRKRMGVGAALQAEAKPKGSGTAAKGSPPKTMRAG